MNYSHTNTRVLRNVKHVGSVRAMRAGIDAYLRGIPHTRFNPARTSNPDVARQWEERVAAMHAKVAIFHKAPRKRLSSKFDKAPVAPFDSALLRPAYEIISHPDGGVTVWYHPEGQATADSTHASGDNATQVIPHLKAEAFAAYNAQNGWV